MEYMVAGSNMSMIATMWNNHLKDNNLGYWEHWWRAMKYGGWFEYVYDSDNVE